MAGIGHNSGELNASGHSFRAFAWHKARAVLLPHLPVEGVRRRVKPAQALGLPDKTYAGFRASTGHDLIGLMFSPNALRMKNDDNTVRVHRAAGWIAGGAYFDAGA